MYFNCMHFRSKTTVTMSMNTKIKFSWTNNGKLSRNYSFWNLSLILILNLKNLSTYQIVPGIIFLSLDYELIPVIFQLSNPFPHRRCILQIFTFSLKLLNIPSSFFYFPELRSEIGGRKHAQWDYWWITVATTIQFTWSSFLYTTFAYITSAINIWWT